MLKKIRLIAAIIVFTLACLLFAGGYWSAYIGWFTKAQLVPAVLSGGVMTVVALVAVALIFGRIYCSILCPLGILQDIFSRLGKAGRFYYTKGKYSMRLAFLLFFAASLILGAPYIFTLLEPYSAFGRIAANLLAPLWQLGGNGLAHIAEHYDSYLVASSPIWIKGMASFSLGLITLVIIGGLSFRGGRTWCNTVCPVGTVLGFFNRYALLRFRINADDCVHCGLCAKQCKASCIDSQNADIDASRCVACFNCLNVCPKKAISYTLPRRLKIQETPTKPAYGLQRRDFAVAAAGTVAALFSRPANVLADWSEVDALTRKRPYQREVPVLAPGAHSLQAFNNRCTGCQLCVSICPNHVLSTSDSLLEAPQPTLSFERGYCRPNCVDCTKACPTGAIKPLTLPEKSAVQIGHAVVDHTRCLLSTGEKCVTCSRNCPTTAIEVLEANDAKRHLVINAERCTGCGACEYFCPIRPQSAIQVQGNHIQRRI